MKNAKANTRSFVYSQEYTLQKNLTPKNNKQTFSLFVNQIELLNLLWHYLLGLLGERIDVSSCLLKCTF